METTANNITTKFAERAQKLLAKGFSLIPLQPRGKEPAGGYGVKSKTKDAAQIARWTEMFPDGNVGVVADQDFVILDIDDLEAAEKDKLVFNTYTVQSSPGKAHLYFKRNGFTVGNLELGTLGSLRAENMYVVGEGSIHPKTGQPYVATNEAPIAELQKGFYQHLQSLARMAAHRQQAAINWDGHSKISEGGRQGFLCSQAGKMWTGEQSEEELLERLEAINQGFCDPPKEPHKVQGIVSWIMEQEPNKPSSRVYVGSSGPQAKEEKQEQLVKTLQELRESAARLGQTPFLIPRFLPARMPHIMPGDSGLGKTPLVAQIGVALALGQDFLTRQSLQPRKVLIVDYESGGQMLTLLDTLAVFLGHKPEELNDWLTIIDGTEWEQHRVLSAADYWKAELVIVDALRGFSSAEAKNEDAGNLIQELQKQGSSWLLVHHLRKNPAHEQARRPPLDKEDIRVMEWMNAVAGARALVNQTHARLPVDHAQTGQADLVIRPYIKGMGETGRIYLSRVFDENGEPVGYERAQGETLLSLNRKVQFEQVRGLTLTFGEIVEKLKLSRSNVKGFLDDCLQTGLAKKVGAERTASARYAFVAKVPEHPEHLE